MERKIVLPNTSLLTVLEIIVGSIAIMGIWRGLWNILDRYLFPNSFILSQIIPLLVGVLVLVILSRKR